MTSLAENSTEIRDSPNNWLCGEAGTDSVSGNPDSVYSGAEGISEEKLTHLARAFVPNGRAASCTEGTSPQPYDCIIDPRRLSMANSDNSEVSLLSSHFIGPGLVSNSTDSKCDAVRTAPVPAVVSHEAFVQGMTNVNGCFFADKMLGFQPWNLNLDTEAALTPHSVPPVPATTEDNHIDASSEQQSSDLLDEWNAQMKALLCAAANSKTEGDSPMLCVKNTFLNLEHPAVTVQDVRSRTESADAVLVGAVNARRKFAGGRLFDDGFTVYENAEYEPPEKGSLEEEDDDNVGVSSESDRVTGHGSYDSPDPATGAFDDWHHLDAVCRRLSAQSGYDTAYTDTPSPEHLDDSVCAGGLDVNPKLIQWMLEATGTLRTNPSGATAVGDPLAYPTSALDPCLALISPPAPCMPQGCPSQPQSPHAQYYAMSETAAAAITNNTSSRGPSLGDSSYFHHHQLLQQPSVYTVDGGETSILAPAAAFRRTQAPEGVFQQTSIQKSPRPASSGVADSSCASSEADTAAARIVEQSSLSQEGAGEQILGGQVKRNEFPSVEKTQVDGDGENYYGEGDDGPSGSRIKDGGAGDGTQRQSPLRAGRTQDGAKAGRGGQGSSKRGGGNAGPTAAAGPGGAAGGGRGSRTRPGARRTATVKGSSSGAAGTVPPANPEGRTTIMLRNIPNKYTQQMLLQVIDEADFQGKYDFYYLPIDFHNKCNVGYAFINFTRPVYAEEFWKAFHGFKLDAFKSNKVCEVSWGRVQGLSANIEHYRNSAVMSVPLPHYKPIIFNGGHRVPFPGADGPLPAVKLRPQRR